MSDKTKSNISLQKVSLELPKEVLADLLDTLTKLFEVRCEPRYVHFVVAKNKQQAYDKAAMSLDIQFGDDIILPFSQSKIVEHSSGIVAQPIFSEKIELIENYEEDIKLWKKNHNGKLPHEL